MDKLELYTDDLEQDSGISSNSLTISHEKYVLIFLASIGTGNDWQV